MSERRRYRNPPIREALCEFQFRPGKDWDPTIPGYLHAAVQTSYNGRRGEQRTLETKIEAGGPDAPNIIQTQGPSKAQFFTNDETRMLAVGPNVLSVHMLAPYQASADLEASGWEEFQLRIEEALKKYWELANPLGVHRIGIRYVNNIRVRAKSISILDYLAAGPLEVQGLPDQMVGFVSRTEYRYEDNILLVVSQGTVPAPAEHLGLVLDLDVIWRTEEGQIGLEEALNRAADLRTREREAFELHITDKARELFDGVHTTDS